MIIDPESSTRSSPPTCRSASPTVLALSQRPIAAAAFGEKTGHPAWKDLPSWAAVGTEDKAAGSDLVRSMAQRANATITEITAPT